MLIRKDHLAKLFPSLTGTMKFVAMGVIEYLYVFMHAVMPDNPVDRA